MIAYIHQRSGAFEATLAVDLPLKQDLDFIYNNYSSHLSLQLGYSLVHPEDQFCRSVGRSIAEHNIKVVTTTIKSVEFRNNRHIFHFQIVLPSLNKSRKDVLVQFGLSTIKETDQVRLIYGNIYDYNS